MTVAKTRWKKSSPEADGFNPMGGKPTTDWYVVPPKKKAKPKKPNPKKAKR